MNIDYFFTKTGKINSKKLKDFPESFYEMTNFLDEYSPTLTHRLKAIKFNIHELPHCVVCDKPHANYSKRKNELFRDTCSYECSQKNPQRIEKIKKNTNYNSAKEKRRQTNIDRYGKEIPTDLQQVVKKKYGVENTSQLDFVKEKKKLKKRTKETIEKTKQSRIVNNDQYWWNREWLYNQIVIENKSCKKIAEENNLAFTTIYNTASFFKIDYFKGCSSDAENELAEFISQFVSILKNDRKIIHPYELDIVIPSHNLAIEYNGLFWHNDERVDSKYHYRKYSSAKEKGIDLIQIFENEWLFKKNQVISILKSRLGLNHKIHGRKCFLKSIDKELEKQFMNDNHIQGHKNSFVCFGLFHESELVSCMSFGKSRFNKKYEWELLRFANKSNTTVIGGASKLFKKFIEEYQPNSIVSYSDNRLFNGNLYSQLGFNYSHESSPNYFYFKGANLFLSRYQCQKHKLEKLLGSDNFDPSLSEYDNMKKNNYKRIFDCGNKIWIWKSKNSG